MKRFAISMAAMLLSSLPTVSLFAQEGPPPRDGGQGPRPERREGLNRPDGGDRPDGPGRGEGPGRPGGPGGFGTPGSPGGRPGGDGPGRGGPRDGEVRLPPHLQMLANYLQVVEQYTKMAKDPATSGVAAVISAADMLKPRGADAGVQYFTTLLPDVKNETVQRAIRMQLFNLYKDSGQQDKALEQLKVMMTAQ